MDKELDLDSLFSRLDKIPPENLPEALSYRQGFIDALFLSDMINAEEHNYFNLLIYERKVQCGMRF